MLRFKKPNGDSYSSLQELHMRDITTEYNVRNKNRLPLDIYSVNNIEGFLPQSEQFDEAGYLHNTDTSIYMIVPNGCFAYNPARIDIGSIGYQNTGRDVQVSSLYVVFKTSDEVDDNYLWQWFHTNHFRNSVRRLQEGGVRLYYYYDKLEETRISLPCLEEQQKIADCLSSVDAVIADYEAQVENMQNQKKGVMQKLFSQEVRFKADDGSEYPEWRKEPLGNFGLFSKGSGLSWDVIDDTGCYECILYGNLYTDYGAVIEKVFYHTNESSEKKSRVGDILIPASDTTPTGLARASCIMVDNVMLGGDINILTPNDDIYGPCLSYCINANKKELLKVVQGSTVRHLKGSDLKGVAIAFPTDLEEQQKIADCLSAFDDAIEDLQKTVEHWKNIKKGLLQQLFA